MVVAKPMTTMEIARWQTQPKSRRRPRPQPIPRYYLFVLWLCLFVFAANAVLYGFIAASSARLNELTRRVTAAEEAGRALELEIAYLSSYPRIVRDAEVRLAMRPPTAGSLRAAAYAPPASFAPDAPGPSMPTGLLATIDDWLRAFGRAAASVR